MIVLVTGSDGHLAGHVIPLLKQRGHNVCRMDLPDYDVTDLAAFRRFVGADACIHLAGLKYADRAELDPLPTVDVNVRGTANVVAVFGARCVVASTCKAADPETVYGASKLIAERIALEAGARVVRLVNVLGSPGSVTDIWAQVPPDEPLPVCDATRLFMEPDHAAQMFVAAPRWPAGRYGPAGVSRARMIDVAQWLHPGRQMEWIPLRRGDRREERLLAECEQAATWDPGVVRITSQHDPVAAAEREPLAA
jgi:UDP-N-acetylglucosamine 4,6-dehydratase/5-epimerase